MRNVDTIEDKYFHSIAYLDNFVRHAQLVKSGSKYDYVFSYSSEPRQKTSNLKNGGYRVNDEIRVAGESSCFSAAGCGAVNILGRSDIFWLWSIISVTLGWHLRITIA
ncbi:hypothetical protein ACS0PU_000121 [Formica fusca]